MMTLIRKERCDVLSLTHTPCSRKDVNVSILWYFPLPPHAVFEGYSYKLFKCKGELNGHYKAFFHAAEFMDRWVAPHRLVSVSTFEEKHPNIGTELMMNVVVVYRGTYERRNPELETKIYNLAYLDTYIQDRRLGWDDALRTASSTCGISKNDKGIFSSFNLS